MRYSAFLLALLASLATARPALPASPILLMQGWCGEGAPVPIPIKRKGRRDHGSPCPLGCHATCERRRKG